VTKMTTVRRSPSRKDATVREYERKLQEVLAKQRLLERQLQQALGNQLKQEQTNDDIIKMSDVIETHMAEAAKSKTTVEVALKKKPVSVALKKKPKPIRRRGNMRSQPEMIAFRKYLNDQKRKKSEPNDSDDESWSTNNKKKKKCARSAGKKQKGEDDDIRNILSDVDDDSVEEDDVMTRSEVDCDPIEEDSKTIAAVEGAVIVPTTETSEETQLKEVPEVIRNKNTAGMFEELVMMGWEIEADPSRGPTEDYTPPAVATTTKKKKVEEDIVQVCNHRKSYNGTYEILFGLNTEFRMWGPSQKVYHDIHLYKKLPLLDEYMAINKLSYEDLGITLPKVREKKTTEEDTDTPMKECDVNHKLFTNFEPVTNAGYCAENSILHGVKCSVCMKLFVSGNKKEVGVFDKRKNMIFNLYAGCIYFILKMILTFIFFLQQ
jgi:hypothetical protein